jgi:hypothetical protein
VPNISFKSHEHDNDSDDEWCDALLQVDSLIQHRASLSLVTEDPFPPLVQSSRSIVSMVNNTI